MGVHPYVYGIIACFVLGISIILAFVTAPVGAEIMSGRFFCAYTAACAQVQLAITTIVLISAFLIFIIFWESAKVRVPSQKSRARKRKK